MKLSQDQLQSIGTILALVISSLALFVSVYEAQIMKSQQKALVWPYLYLSLTYNSDQFAVRIKNNGTGPAIVKSVQVDYKKHPIPSLDILLDSLKSDRTFGYNIVINNSLNNYVFKPAEELTMFGFYWTDETREVVKRVEKDVRIQICYESVLGESWLYDSRDGSHQKKKFRSALEFHN